MLIPELKSDFVNIKALYLDLQDSISASLTGGAENETEHIREILMQDVLLFTAKVVSKIEEQCK